MLRLKSRYKGYPIEITIDQQDLHFCSVIHITKQKNAKLRVAIKINGKYQYLHRVLLGITDPKVMVDHIDGDPLNNCRSNLRIATYSQNAYNRTKTRVNKSGFKGVWKRNDGRDKVQ